MPSIKLSGKNKIFDDKKINKSNFYKNKEIYNIDDIDVNKVLVSKKEFYDKKSQLNTSLDIMKMISVDHYV